MTEKVIVITGPTGVGKTDISLKLCEKFNGEVINADASQFKKELNVGTAKIELTDTNIVHHLIDVINYDEMYSINDFQTNARKLIKSINEDNKIPFLVGGSGLYINAVLNDYNLDSPKRDEDIESKYFDFSNEDLHKLLEELDYETSKLIHANNRRRVLRAIELAGSGKSISGNQNGSKLLYDSLIICINTNRETLYERINKRVLVMLENGWIDECKYLLETKRDVSKIKDIGYQEVFEYLKGSITKEEMIEVISKKTRNYAKRQLTWMRNKMNCVFVLMDYENQQNTLDEISKLINDYLKR